VAWAFTPRLRLASAVCTGLRDSCCGEPLAEGYNNAQNCWPTRTQLLASALHDASCAKNGDTTAAACSAAEQLQRLLLIALIGRARVPQL
jgi:hypothetical protein